MAHFNNNGGNSAATNFNGQQSTAATATTTAQPQEVTLQELDSQTPAAEEAGKGASFWMILASLVLSLVSAVFSILGWKKSRNCEKLLEAANEAAGRQEQLLKVIAAGSIAGGKTEEQIKADIAKVEAAMKAAAEANKKEEKKEDKK